MTIAKDFVAKASVALVAAAMIFTMFAPSAKAQSSEDLQKMINDLLAQIAALQAQVGQGSASTASGVCPYTWTRDLSSGATGADVMKLQQFLNSNADTRVAATGAGSVGMETEYYGPATAAAVSKFQVMYRAEVLVGLVNPTGYFGPASRAKANALCVAAPVVVPPTDGGNGTSTDGGDDSATLEGGAGSISITKTTSDVEDNVNTGSSENVLGFKVEASDSDVEVTNVKVTMTAGIGSGSNRLERYFDSFDIVMDGEVVGSMDAADFNRDSSGEYSRSISLSKAVVREGDKLTFYVVAHAVSSKDSGNTYTWTAKVSDVRYRDAQDAILTSSTVVTDSGITVVKLSLSSDVKVKLSLDSSNPVAQAVKVSDDSSGDLVTLLTFKVKAEGTDIDFDQVRFRLATSSGSDLADMVSEYRFMRGSTLVQTADNSDLIASSTAILEISLDDSEMVDQDETVTYSLVAKMNKNTFIGDSITASMTGGQDSYWLNANDANGDAIDSTRFSGSAIGNAQTFRADGLFVDVKSAKGTATGVDNVTDPITFEIVMDVTADGDTYSFSPTSTPFAYTIKNSADATYASSTGISSVVSSNATKVNGVYQIDDGQTKSVTLTIRMDQGAPSEFYKAILSTLTYGVGTAVAGESINLTPVDEFTTNDTHN